MNRSESHPVHVLIAEHEVILSVLDGIQREVERLAEGRLRRPFWERCVSFLREFADRCHHGKEEELLFPMLERAGITAPVAVMRMEHDEGRALVRQMQQATEDGQADALAMAARSFVHLLRQHIDKENQVLFPMAQQALGADATEELQRSFLRAEQEILPVRDKRDHEAWAAGLAEA